MTEYTISKKTENLYRKLKCNINIIVELYEHGFKTFDESVKAITEEEEEFSSMRDSMYRYGLISEKDYSATTHMAWMISNMAHERCIEIKYSK